MPRDFGFDGRNRRPPRDPFNVLLSLGYSTLYAHTETMLRVSGLNPWSGFYHQPHGNHAVLASDLMEPFRHLVERVALNALIQQQLTVDDFWLDAQQRCWLKIEARKRYFVLLGEQFEKPFATRFETDKPMKLVEHLLQQNRALTLWIRGKEPHFEAWRVR